MKHLLGPVFLLALLAGCQAQPAYTDNGNPGQIQAVAFYDDNHNGRLDSGEAGLQGEMGISQDVSCPASSRDRITVVNTDASGVALFTDLKPGRYCVGLVRNYGMTTQATQLIYVSSDMRTSVVFGVVRE